MKTWKHCAIACILTIIAFALLACNEPDPVCVCPEGTTHKTDEKCCTEADCKCPITREFKFQAGITERYMIVRDTRTDPEDVDLETLGIITKLRTAIKSPKSTASFNLIFVMQRNPEIIVEVTTEYPRCHVYSGNKMGVRFSYVSSADVDDLVEKLGEAINIMSGRTY